MGNSCFQSCSRKTIVIKKQELDVEEIFKNIESENLQKQKSIFNVNKKSIKNRSKSSNNLNVSHYSEEKFDIKSKSNRIQRSQKRFKGNRLEVNDALSPKVRENSFIYKESEENLKNENTLGKKRSKEKKISNKKIRSHIGSKNNLNNIMKLNNENNEEIINSPENKNNISNSFDSVFGENSQIEENKIERKEKDNLIKKFFGEILTCRENVLNYSKKIENYMQLIRREKKEIILEVMQNNFIAKNRLVTGKPAFREAIKHLQYLNEEKINFKRLEFVEDLKIPFPYRDVEKAKNFSFIKKQYEKLKEKFKGKYELTNFHFDISYKNPEISTIMQIVDDSFGSKKRQSNILDKYNKYIGISYGEIGNDRIIIYYVFAK